MGRYNPHQPIILGQEWVPIRDEVTLFSPAVNAGEVGHGFTLDQQRMIQEARFYIQNPPVFLGQSFLAAVYAQGTEDLCGPIQSLMIPVNAGAITGGGISSSGNTVAEAVATPGDGRNIIFINNVASSRIVFFFAVNNYTILSGRRILGVRLHYIVNGLFVPQTDVGAFGEGITNSLKIRRDNGTGVTFVGLRSDTDTLAGGIATGTLQKRSFGEVNHLWTPSSPITTTDRMPWRFTELQLFEASSGANRMFVEITLPFVDNSDVGTLSYLAMEVLYCFSERRLIYGGRAFGGSTASEPAVAPYVTQTNIIPMRNTSFVVNPVLPPGDYTLTLTSPDQGDYIGGGSGAVETVFFAPNQTNYPDVNALRELYQIPTHPGVQVDIPFPVDDHIGEEFNAVTTHILPQLSLHVTGGAPVTEVHVYGRQGAAFVFGGNGVRQEIDDDSVSPGVYDQVRFYARRFGNTTNGLVLAASAGGSVQISVAEFDVLPELVDGWKEVTLKFTGTAPTMGGGPGVFPNGTWSSAGTASSDRWEILAACAPAISGVPGNIYNLVPTAQQLGAATYEPPNGTAVELNWMPQGVASMFVTSPTDDDGCDAVLIFSLTPPAITGLTVIQQSQQLTVFTECGSGPCCTPIALQYNRITWSPTTLTTTGFGSYELQRLDTVDPTWDTVMLATSSPIVTGFNDYEARVGVMSSYRIRVNNVLNFASDWSVTGVGTIAAPGVTLPSCGSNGRGVLIFTSNESQSGVFNLAYAMTWENAPFESFNLIEADSVDITTHHDRDYQVAHHGEERGGESFTRELLLANAAVPIPRLGNVHSLRDMAWADLPYVCVRDDIGDRWLATVIVPASVTRRNRRLYNAQITVIEVTSTPSPVDP